MRLVCEEAGRETIRRVADEDLARLGGLLEPRRDVHGVAEHAELALLVADGARDREPGVDPDPQREVATGALGDAFVLAVERSEDRKRGPLGARGMIDLVVGRAEDRDHSVADVLLDESVERPDLDGDRVPGGAHVLVELFRIEALRERGESRYVGEKHRDLFCLTLDGLSARRRAPHFPQKLNATGISVAHFGQVSVAPRISAAGLRPWTRRSGVC